VISTTRPWSVCLWHLWDNDSDSVASWLSAHVYYTCLQLNLQLHTIGLVRTCRTSSFCIVAWQLARFQLTRRIARSLGDSWASCNTYMHVRIGNAYVKRCLWHAELGLCRPNGRVSVSPPVCPVDRQQRAAGLLLSAGACSRCRSIAAGTCAQQQMRAASCGEPKDEVQHRLVFAVLQLRIRRCTDSLCTDSFNYMTPLL